MQYDFLKAFSKRMKVVGLHAVIVDNSRDKGTWKQFGINSFDEQLNIVYSVLLFVMEQSLKEENCTIDDISGFIDDINTQYYGKPLTASDCRELGVFIVNNILSNEGRTMYFESYDYEEMSNKSLHISYLGNRIVYDEEERRRTSYYLTDDGYNLLLGTLEIESNMKLTIQEMIFKLHLEKQSYDKALDDVKNIFNLMRIQLQKIQEAMQRIRRNALDYDVVEYSKLLQENLDTINQTKEKFKGYRDTVHTRVREMETGAIDVSTLDDNDSKLRDLREIERYLNRAIDEHQRILNNHFDLKALYTVELEKLTEFSLVQRFNLRSDLYDKVLENPDCLSRLEYFFRPLFNKNPEKVFNINKIFEKQKLHEEDDISSTDATEFFDQESWEAEQERLRQAKLAVYYGSLFCIMKRVAENKSVRLSALAKELNDTEELRQLIPNTHIFKEIMVELLKVQTLDLDVLREEKTNFLQDKANEFQMAVMILNMLEDNPEWNWIKFIDVTKYPEAEPVLFKGVTDGLGHRKNIRCSDVLIRGREKNDGIRN